MTKFTDILFDLDGALTDSGGRIAATIRQVLAEPHGAG